MKIFQYLNGALVPPDLHPDPACRQRQVGIFDYASSAEDIGVRFGGGREATYDSHNLMMLNYQVALLPELKIWGTAITLDDVKALYKIMLLQQEGASEAWVNVMQLAGDHPHILEKALKTVAPAAEGTVSSADSR